MSVINCILIGEHGAGKTRLISDMTQHLQTEKYKIVDTDLCTAETVRRLKAKHKAPDTRVLVLIETHLDEAE